MATLQPVVGGEGLVPALHTAEGDPGTGRAGDGGAELGCAEVAVGALLVAVQHGGHRVLHGQGVARLDLLGGHHVSAHSLPVLHPHQAAQGPQLLVTALAQPGNGGILPLLHHDRLLRQAPLAADRLADLLQRLLGLALLLLLQLGSVRLQRLLGLTEGGPGLVKVAGEEMTLGPPLVQFVPQLLGVAGAQSQLDVLEAAGQVAQVELAGGPVGHRVGQRLLASHRLHHAHRVQHGRLLVPLLLEGLVALQPLGVGQLGVLLLEDRLDHHVVHLVQHGAEHHPLLVRVQLPEGLQAAWVGLRHHLDEGTEVSLGL